MAALQSGSKRFPLPGPTATAVDEDNGHPGAIIREVQQVIVNVDIRHDNPLSVSALRRATGAFDCHARNSISFALEVLLVILLGDTWFLLRRSKGLVV